MELNLIKFNASEIQMICSFVKNQRVKSLEFVDKLNIKLTINGPKFKKISESIIWGLVRNFLEFLNKKEEKIFKWTKMKNLKMPQKKSLIRTLWCQDQLWHFFRSRVKTEMISLWIDLSLEIIVNNLIEAIKTVDASQHLFYQNKFTGNYF